MNDTKLEKIEWSQVWREYAPDDKTPRVLLLGDSIVIGYRHLTEEKLQGKYHVTAYSTSKALDNPYLAEEVEFVCRQDGCDYAVVHVNNGLHGWHLSEEDYERAYEAYLLRLRGMFPRARFILALSTPLMREDDPAEIDETKNAPVLRRNEAALRLARKLNMEVDDLYTAALSEKGLHCADAVHFTDHGYDVLSDRVAKAIG